MVGLSLLFIFSCGLICNICSFLFQVASKSLFVTIKGTEINGYIEESQLDTMWAIPEDYKEGSLHSAYVLHKFPYAKTVALSFKSDPTIISRQELNLGTILENAEV